MDHPGTTPLPVPCSPGNHNSSRKEDALSLQAGEGGGKAGRQALACQEGPGPTPTKTGTNQTIGMPIKPVLRFPKPQGCHSWLGVVENPGDRRPESAEDNTTVPDVSLWTQLRSLSPLAGSQHPRDPRKHSSSPHLACSTEQTEAGWEAPA